MYKRLSSRLLTVGLVVGLVVAGVWWHQTAGAPEQQTSQPPIKASDEGPWLSPTLGASAPRSVASGSMLLTERLPHQSDADIPLSQALRKASNLRSFADSAARRHTEGGVYYAERARDYCRFVRRATEDFGDRVRPQTGESGQQAALRRERYDLLQSRCQGFSDDDLKGNSALALGLDVQAKNDPAMNLAKRYESQVRMGQTPTLEIQANAIAELLAVQNYDLFVDARLGDTQDGRYFAGEWFIYRSSPTGKGNYPVHVLDAGIQLAGCLLGQPCNATEVWLVDAECSFGGTCHPNLEAFLRESLTKRFGAQLGEKGFLRAKALAQPIATAFKSRDVKAFLPPR
jgi:hypothetical protein